MDADDETLPNQGEDGEVTTVARSVLAAYFDKLATTDGFTEIASRLRKVVLDDGQFSDTAIRAAIFPDVT
jgi:hypothetical protein